LTASAEYQSMRRLLLVVLGVEDADVVFAEIIRLGLHLRNQVLADDRHRHGPERVEVDLHDLAADVRRGPVRLAGNGSVARHRDAVFDRLDLGRRNVGDHDAVAEIAGKAFQPDRVGPQLRQPPLGRYIERPQRRLVHHTVGVQPVAHLKAAHRGVDVGIEHLAVAGIELEIARDRQPLA
jgi:hypothetical protein